MPDDRLRQAVSAIRTLYVAHPAAEAATAEIRRLHAGCDAGLEGECMLLIGQTRSGKSTILKRYTDRHPPSLDGDRDRRPVVYIDVPSRCTVKSLAETLLTRLGDRFPHKGSEPSMTERVLWYLQAQKTELLILDEFQHLIDRRSQRVHYDVANWVKQLLNRMQRPILLAGLPTAADVLDADRQLEWRCAGTRQLAPFDWDDANDRQRFRGVLKKFDEQLRDHGSIGRLSDLAEPETAYRIHQATGGLIGGVARLLTASVRIAVPEEAPRLSPDILQQASLRLPGADNPPRNRQSLKRRPASAAERSTP
jgi:hypothetical protein